MPAPARRQGWRRATQQTPYSPIAGARPNGFHLLEQAEKPGSGRRRYYTRSASQRRSCGCGRLSVRLRPVFCTNIPLTPVIPRPYSPSLPARPLTRPADPLTRPPDPASTQPVSSLQLGRDAEHGRRRTTGTDQPGRRPSAPTAERRHTHDQHESPRCRPPATNVWITHTTTNRRLEIRAARDKSRGQRSLRTTPPVGTRSARAGSAGSRGHPGR
jgi:hypothetical protein